MPQPPTRKSVRIPTPSQIEVIDRRSADIMRRMSPAEKIQRSFAMADRARAMVRVQIAHLHPEWTSEQVQAELVRRARHAN